MITSGRSTNTITPPNILLPSFQVPYSSPFRAYEIDRLTFRSFTSSRRISSRIPRSLLDPAHHLTTSPDELLRAILDYVLHSRKRKPVYIRFSFSTNSLSLLPIVRRISRAQWYSCFLESPCTRMGIETVRNGSDRRRSRFTSSFRMFLSF